MFRSRFVQQTCIIFIIRLFTITLTNSCFSGSFSSLLNLHYAITNLPILWITSNSWWAPFSNWSNSTLRISDRASIKTKLCLSFVYNCLIRFYFAKTVGSFGSTLSKLIKNVLFVCCLSAWFIFFIMAMRWELSEQTAALFSTKFYKNS